MIGECLVAPQTAGPPSQVSVGLFAPYQRGPVASLRTINVHWLLRRHRTVVAVLLPTGLKKSSSLFFPPSTKNNRSSFHTPLTFYLSARGCSINQMKKREESVSLLWVLETCALRRSSGTFTKSDAHQEFQSAAHCCCTQPHHGTKGLRTGPAEVLPQISSDQLSHSHRSK